MKKKTNLPKKTKLISDGGFYKIIDTPKPFVYTINIPVFRLLRISEPSIDYLDTFSFELSFAFIGVKKGYAEYRQYKTVKIEERTK